MFLYLFSHFFSLIFTKIITLLKYTHLKKSYEMELQTGTYSRVYLYGIFSCVKKILAGTIIQIIKDAIKICKHLTKRV